LSSTSTINFSVRQNKCIERLIVFNGLRRVADTLALENMVYLGFGSVWFSDFVLAHRGLRINTMLSIESNPIIYRRALFNRPFRTVQVFEGESDDLIPELLTNDEFLDRPWIVWLDYDGPIDEKCLNELAYLVNNLPQNSALITTCNARPHRYGKPAKRVDSLNSLFGDLIGMTLDDSMVENDVPFMNTLRQAIENFLLSTALQNARAGGFVPAFNVGYQDGPPMVTVGGILPSVGNTSTVQGLTRKRDWEGLVSHPITTAPLTMKEVGALQAQLPSRKKITRKRVQRLGFDLEEEQIDSFARHYLLYPNFVQAAT
jgi:hypothetical protein